MKHDKELIKQAIRQILYELGYGGYSHFILPQVDRMLDDTKAEHINRKLYLLLKQRFEHANSNVY